jgi:hypothetical protein
MIALNARALLLLSLVLVACSSDSNPTGSNRGKLGACYGSSGQTCTGIDAYESCEISHCGTQLQACFGKNFQSGDTSGGSCAAFFNCEAACACGDTSCVAGCIGAASADCKSCLQTAGTCETNAGCTQPMCSGGTADAGSSGSPDAKTSASSCADLTTCCGMVPSAQQAACNAIAGSGMQSICAQSLQDFQKLGYCH